MNTIFPTILYTLQTCIKTMRDLEVGRRTYFGVVSIQMRAFSLVTSTRKEHCRPTTSLTGFPVPLTRMARAPRSLTYLIPMRTAYIAPQILTAHSVAGKTGKLHRGCCVQV